MITRDAEGAAPLRRGPLDPRVAEVDEEQVHAGVTVTDSTWPGSQVISMFMGAQQTSQSSMVE